MRVCAPKLPCWFLRSEECTQGDRCTRSHDEEMQQNDVDTAFASENVDEGSVVSEATACRVEGKNNSKRGEGKDKKRKAVTDAENQQICVRTEVAYDSGVDGSAVSESTFSGIEIRTRPRKEKGKPRKRRSHLTNRRRSKSFLV